ncbi:hypothetical protein CVT23_05530 [Minwuia thermotolerans]|uniref:Uncharacterized protein n=1 Tax=Minwuia thermotolerans TaxID=2056226 RepID=A0A2M9G532_9PROT|nr:hypothetical protein CVT23_05530 [Minwuia thermotolerans]
MNAIGRLTYVPLLFEFGKCAGLGERRCAKRVDKCKYGFCLLGSRKTEYQYLRSSLQLLAMKAGGLGFRRLRKRSDRLRNSEALAQDRYQIQKNFGIFARNTHSFGNSREHLLIDIGWMQPCILY